MHVPPAFWIGRAGHEAHRHRLRVLRDDLAFRVFGIDDILVILHELAERPAQRLDIGTVVEFQLDMHHQPRFLLGPVLEAVAGEIADRCDQAAFVPGAQPQMGEADLFDIAPLPVITDRIADPRGLGEGDLHTRHDVAQHLARGKG